MSRDLRDLPIDLALVSPVKRGSAPIGSIKKQIGGTWRRSKRSRGGDWIGTALYEGEDFEKLDLFLDGLNYQIVERLGGSVTWAGFLAEMRLTLDGLEYVRRWADIANRVQAIFTRLGDNLLSNPSVETGNWTAYGAPGTLAQDSSWVSDGAVSEHIIGGAGDGVLIQAGMVIVAGKAYDAQLTAKIASGTWRLEVYRTDTGARLASTDEATVGQKVMRASIADSNIYAGAVGVRFYATIGGEAWADGASFRESPQQARTSWLADANSMAEFGTLESSLLMAGMSDNAANAHAATHLAKQAWPRTLAPGNYGGSQFGADGVTLALTFLGKVFTLRNKYNTRPATTQNASVHIANLITDSEFVGAGVIETNALQWQLEDRAPLRAWELIRDITEAGDTTGARWNCGVYGDGLFDYGPASTVVDYHYSKGKISSISGSVLDPWLILPGNMYLDDTPAAPGALTANAADDPHVMFIEEVEFDAAAWLREESGISFRREAGSDAL